MCTLGFLFGLEQTRADLIIREHKSLPKEAVTELQPLGKIETGELFEQLVSLSYLGQSILVWRVELRLHKPTRNAEKEIAILTMLLPAVANAAKVAELYRGRRSGENLFQTVTDNYQCEIQTLGYPQAALFSTKQCKRSFGSGKS